MSHVVIRHVEITTYITWPSYMCTRCTYNEMFNLKKLNYKKKEREEGGEGGREGGRKEGKEGGRRGIKRREEEDR